MKTTYITDQVDNSEVRVKTQAVSRSSSKRLNALVGHIPSEATDRLISYISEKLGWTPDPCMLREDHPRYGTECQ